MAKEALYTKLRNAEEVQKEFGNDFDRFQKVLGEYKKIPGFTSMELKGYPEFNVPAYQKQIMQNYEKNPVFMDSVNGKISIEDTLNELSVVNKGIRKYLPRRKNKSHNERIEQVGELVEKPTHLRKNGIFVPDNFVTTFTEANAIFLPIVYGVFKEIDPSASFSQLIVPMLFSEIGPFAVSWGLQLNGRMGFGSHEEAKYIDTKIEELY
jgi:hypothetical protein